MAPASLRAACVVLVALGAAVALAGDAQGPKESSSNSGRGPLVLSTSDLSLVEGHGHAFALFDADDAAYVYTLRRDGVAITEVSRTSAPTNLYGGWYYQDGLQAARHGRVLLGVSLGSDPETDPACLVSFRVHDDGRRLEYVEKLTFGDTTVCDAPTAVAVGGDDDGYAYVLCSNSDTVVAVRVSRSGRLRQGDVRSLGVAVGGSQVTLKLVLDDRALIVTGETSSPALLITLPVDGDDLGAPAVFVPFSDQTELLSVGVGGPDNSLAFVTTDENAERMFVFKLTEHDGVVTPHLLTQVNLPTRVYYALPLPDQPVVLLLGQDAGDESNAVVNALTIDEHGQVTVLPERTFLGLSPTSGLNAGTMALSKDGDFVWVVLRQGYVAGVPLRDNGRPLLSNVQGIYVSYTTYISAPNGIVGV